MRHLLKTLLLGAAALTLVTVPLHAAALRPALGESASFMNLESTDPVAWLIDQVQVGRLNHNLTLQFDALKRLTALEPDNPYHRLELLRLKLTYEREDTAGVKALQDELCSLSTTDICRQTRALMRRLSPEGAGFDEQLNLYLIAHQFQSAAALIEEQFPPEDRDTALSFIYAKTLLEIPERRGEGMSLLRRLSRNERDPLTAQDAKQLYNERRLDLLMEETENLIFKRETREAGLRKAREALALALENDDPRAGKISAHLREGAYYAKVDEAERALSRAQYRRALALSREALALDPALPDAHTVSGDALAAIKDYVSARKAYHKALKAQGLSAGERERLEARLTRLKVLPLEEDLKRAQSVGDTVAEAAVLAQILKVAPDPWYALDLGLLQLKNGDPEAAKALFENRPANDSAAWDHAHALLLSRMGDTEGALKLLNGSLKADPSLNSLRTRLEDELIYTRSLSLEDEGKTHEAVALLEHLREPAPYMLMHKATLLSELSDYAAALKTLEGTHDRAALLLKARLTLASTATLEGDREKEAAYAQARSYLKEARESPESLTLGDYRALAQSYREAGDMTEAAALLSAGAQLLDNDAGTLTFNASGTASQEAAPESAELSFDVVSQEGKAQSRAASLPSPASVPEMLPELLPEDEAQFRLEYARTLQSDPKAFGLDGDSADKAALTQLGRGLKALSLLKNPADLSELTFATRTEDYAITPTAPGLTPLFGKDEDLDGAEESWLARSLKSDVAALSSRIPLITVGTDFSRDSGTEGYSDLTAFTTMAEVDLPLGSGYLTLRADEVYLDAGRLTHGPYDSKFGSMYVTGTERAPGRQDATGTALAVAYSTESFAFDIGTTPLGFEEETVVGSLTLNGEAGNFGLSATLYRRPETSSLLSYAGQKDPLTGKTWGSVIRNGVRLSLSHDLGLENGFWGFVSYEDLGGENVEDNSALQIMAGYYRRLINRSNEELRAGLSAMYWTFDEDQSEYTLGNGGYYSPELYLSAGPNLTYRKRSASWSVELAASAGLSRSRTQDHARYPDRGLIPSSLPDRNAWEEGDNSTGLSGGLKATVERRLTEHLIVGGFATYQHSDGYTPFYAGLYFRVSVDPLNGDLPLPPQPLVPYGEW